MIAVIVILVFAVYLAFFFPEQVARPKQEEKSPKYKSQMKKLWQIAQTAMKERKPFRAEKALLTILKFDEKNAAAYNRLGILYAKGKKYDEAVECFEIAQSLDSNPASIHNVGLIYLETGAYEKAEMALQQAINLEGDVPSRYIALAKAEEKLGRPKKAVEALENAYELDPNVSTLRQILAIYENNDDAESVATTAARIEEQIMRDNEAKKRKKRAAAKAPSRLRATSRRQNATRSKVPAKATTQATSRSATQASPRATAQATARPATPAKLNTKSAPRIIKPHAGRKRI